MSYYVLYGPFWLRPCKRCTHDWINHVGNRVLVRYMLYFPYPMHTIWLVLCISSSPQHHYVLFYAFFFNNSRLSLFLSLSLSQLSMAGNVFLSINGIDSRDIRQFSWFFSLYNFLVQIERYQMILPSKKNVLINFLTGPSRKWLTFNFSFDMQRIEITSMLDIPEFPFLFALPIVVN